MSEEKLYAVKNCEGRYWDFSGKVTGFWARSEVEVPATDDKDLASALAMGSGNVVTFVEEPEKIVITKEQAKIIENARDEEYPATYISNNSDIGASNEEELLMNAYVNGYTVEKEKKYNVKVPHTKDVWYYKASEAYLHTICPADKKLRGKFAESEIEHYGLQDCEKEEVTDDEND